MSSRPPERSTSRTATLVAFYAGSLAAVTVAIVLIIAAGQRHDATEEVAGGYDVVGRSACLGRSFNLEQSGRFVNLGSSDDRVEGKLELRDTDLTGDVQCRDGRSAPLDAEVRRARLAGAVGEEPVVAELTREPPPPAAPPARAPDSLDGDYDLSPRSACLGGNVDLEGDGSRVRAVGEEGAEGRLRYRDGLLEGRVSCARGEARRVIGQAVGREIDMTLLRPGTRPRVGGPAPPGSERLSAHRVREFGSLVALFLAAAAVVMIAARLFGIGAAALGQPRVMGEVLAGIALGPTLLGAVFPGVRAALFPEDIVPFLGVVSQLGLTFYMFLIGLELDLDQLKGKVRQVAAISNVSVALPMLLGIAVALPLYELLAPDTKFAGFALFMGVSMSVTAFPVLARVLVERRMIKRPLGALTLAAAAIDDVTAWFLIALATAVAVAGSGTEVARTIVLAVVFCLVMWLGARPLLARVSTAFETVGRVPPPWVALIFAGVLVSAWATEEIGIALIFGAFVMGLIMPRHAELTEDVTRRMEDFVVTLLLPLFFAYIGLRTDAGLLDRPELWAIAGVLLVTALAGKLFGATIAARLTGLDWRRSTVVGILMNTRGFSELVVLNLALEIGVISEAMFAMLVFMALVTTFMTAPMLNLVDPRNELGAPIEEELVDARAMSMAQFPALRPPEEAILVAPQTDNALAQLRSLAEPLARSEPPRELILARVVRPPRGAAVRGALQTESRRLEEAASQVDQARDELVPQGIAARAVAFISADPGEDLTRLARSEEVALMLLDGVRPLLGEGVPRGDVGAVLRDAPCDVGVLVAREDALVQPGRTSPVVVPFGGAEHDWAALELGAWIASATDAPLRLLGAAGETAERTRVSRLLGDAGLLVQQYAGIPAEPVVTEPGRESVLEAAAGGGLLVIGLSDRWREEGLGPTRSAIVRAAPAPVLFVRRGVRPGALAPREDVTRFAWSAAGVQPRGVTTERPIP